MSTLAVTESSAASSARTHALLAAGSLSAALWLGSGSLSAGNLSALETLNAAVLLLALACGCAFWRGPAHLSRSASGRLWLAGLFSFSALTLTPFFQRATTAQSPSQLPSGLRIAALAPFVFAVLLWLSARLSRTPARPASAPAGIAAQVERLLVSPSVRLNLTALFILIAGAGLGLGGQPLSTLPFRALFIAALLMAVRPILELAALAHGARILCGVLALSLSLCVANGARRYTQMRSQLSSGNTALTQDNPTEANRLHAEVGALNTVLDSRGVLKDADTAWALYYERIGSFEQSLVHWRRIAEMQGIAPETMLPIRRVLCKAGDSLAAWRRMIYFGFPAIKDPEMSPGIRALGDNPKSDLRAKVLAAFLAWEENEPEAERRRRLEEVRKVQPNEPSACNLLRRLGSPTADGPLWIPADLIVGKKMTTRSLLGDIDELGEVDTVVVLDEGNWELSVNARGTPLNEVWPIIRLELNGHVVSETQVTHSENRDVPFTFKVHRGDIYHVKIVFENMQEVLDKGSITRRGLTINGLTLRRSK